MQFLSSTMKTFANNLDAANNASSACYSICVVLIECNGCIDASMHKKLWKIIINFCILCSATQIVMFQLHARSTCNTLLVYIWIKL
jgi:hypothetical protein